MTTTHHIPLPGVRASRPHQFMAALGVLRLLSQPLGWRETRLSWEPDYDHAVLTTRVPSLDEVAAQLHQIAVDGLDPRPWPPARQGTKGGDPALDPELTPTGDETALMWWRACVATGDPRRRGLHTTAYITRTGQQTIRSFFEAPEKHVTAGEPDDMASALQRGHRVHGYTGEGLDAGAYDLDGSNPAADPWQTWLATRAMPDLGPAVPHHAYKVGWARRALGRCWLPTPGGWTMVWPMWTQPLDHAGVSALLSCREWLPRRVRGQLIAHQPTVDQLGIVAAVYAARRIQANSTNDYLWPLQGLGRVFIDDLARHVDPPDPRRDYT